MRIGGHTDDRGRTKHNRLLSRRRTRAVLQHLVDKGVAPERLYAKGYGG